MPWRTARGSRLGTGHYSSLGPATEVQCKLGCFLTSLAFSSRNEHGMAMLE